MGLEATISLAEMDEGGDKKNRVGMQIANPNLVVKTEPPKKRMYRNPKSSFKEIFEHNDLTWLWVGVPLALRRTPSCELLVVEHPMVTRSSMVCSLLLDFHHSFAMTPAFFYASLFAMNLVLLMNEELAEY